MTRAWSIVMKGDMEHCDEWARNIVMTWVMEHCDDKCHAILC